MFLETLENNTVALERWGPFAIPDDNTFQALDMGAIWKANPLQWAMQLSQKGEMFQLDVEPLTTDAVGEFLLEAIAAQALMAIPGMAFEQAMPLECVGRIVTIDFDPHVPRPVSTPRLDRQPRYMDGDPPVPMLFLTGINRKVEQRYHATVYHFLRNGKDIAAFNPILENVLAEMVGHLSRAEVFYFLVRVQSLITGAYKQQYLQHQIMSAGVGHIID